MAGDQTPTVGRIVHYVSHGTPVRDDGTQAYTRECRAAIITEVGPDDPDQLLTGAPDQPDPQVVSLAVFNPTGQFFNRSVPYDDGGGHIGGTWHWPEREG